MKIKEESKMIVTNRFISTVIFIFSAITLIAGIIFSQQGLSKYMLIRELASTEKVTTALSEDQVRRGEIVDSLNRMQAAADVIRTHRQKIAQTYNELLGGGKYDPTNPKQLTYAQAINLENYLYLGVLSFGTTYLMMGIGGFMLLMAVSLGAIGIALRPA
jgi:hypothetical protein